MTEIIERLETFAKDFHADLKKLRGDFVEELLRTEINRGYYGTRAKELFGTLTIAEQDSILHALKLQEQCGGRQLQFTLAIKSLFPDSELYFYKKFLLWLPEPRSEATLNKIELIKILFMDVGNTELELYFGRHFGVFGTPRTMQLDEMILY